MRFTARCGCAVCRASSSMVRALAGFSSLLFFPRGVCWWVEFHGVCGAVLGVVTKRSDTQISGFRVLKSFSTLAKDL